MLNKLTGKGEKFFQVAHIPISKINMEGVTKLRKTLDLITKKSKFDRMLITLNASLGNTHEVVHADLMVDLLNQKRKELGIQMDTYAEDHLFNAAFLIHQIGDNRLANHVSMMGNIGYSMRHNNVKGFMEDWDIKVKLVHKGENKVRLNRLEKLKEEDKQWILNLMNKRVEYMVSEILKKKSAEEGLEEFLRSGKTVFGDKAQQYGLVDGLWESPDAFYQSTQKLKFKIKAPAQSWKQKLGFDEPSDTKASMFDLQSYLPEVEEQEEQVIGFDTSKLMFCQIPKGL